MKITYISAKKAGIPFCSKDLSFCLTALAVVFVSFSFLEGALFITRLCSQGKFIGLSQVLMMALKSCPFGQ